MTDDDTERGDEELPITPKIDRGRKYHLDSLIEDYGEEVVVRAVERVLENNITGWYDDPRQLQQLQQELQQQQQQ